MDVYKFRVPVEFTFSIPGGDENPDWRDKLREECEEVLHTFLRARSHTLLFDYPIQVDDQDMSVSCWVGHLGTIRAPSRFRQKKTSTWREIALDLISRTKHEWKFDQKLGKRVIHKKADIPFQVGKLCYHIVSHISKYQYLCFRHEELLRYWAEKYKTETKPPAPVVPEPKKKYKDMTKEEKAWKAFSLRCEEGS